MTSEHTLTKHDKDNWFWINQYLHEEIVIFMKSLFLFFFSTRTGPTLQHYRTCCQSQTNGYVIVANIARGFTDVHRQYQSFELSRIETSCHSFFFHPTHKTVAYHIILWITNYCCYKRVQPKQLPGHSTYKKAPILRWQWQWKVYTMPHSNYFWINCWSLCCSVHRCNSLTESRGECMSAWSCLSSNTRPEKKNVRSYLAI